MPVSNIYQLSYSDQRTALFSAALLDVVILLRLFKRVFCTVAWLQVANVECSLRGEPLALDVELYLSQRDQHYVDDFPNRRKRMT